MDTILAVDPSQFNSVFCWHEHGTREAHFRTAASTPDDRRRELTPSRAG